MKHCRSTRVVFLLKVVQQSLKFKYLNENQLCENNGEKEYTKYPHKTENIKNIKTKPEKQSAWKSLVQCSMIIFRSRSN